MDSTGKRVGTVIADRYRLEGVLGRGGMGIVYRAVHTLTRREVAVKLLERLEAVDQQNVARFLDEAQAAAKLEHPNVVEVLDMGTLEDGAVYLALELLRGEVLSERLARERRLPPEDAFAVLIPIMNGLAEAHRAGLVHRDLKPANIFLHEVADQLVPKLLDFGVAKRLDGSDLHETQDGQIVGTPYFMAPEQIAGKDVGPRADIFSMAVVWYLVLSGRLPFKGENHFHVLTAISKGEHTHLAEVDDTLPRALADAVEAGLRLDRERRPPDMLAFRDQLLAARPTLRDVLDGDTLPSAPIQPEPAVVVPPPAPRPALVVSELPKPKLEIEPERSPMPFVVIGVAVLAGAILALRSGSEAPEPMPPPPPPPPPIAAPSVDAGAIPPRAAAMKARDAALLAQDALSVRVKEMKASVDAHRAEMERRAKADPNAKESFEASARKADGQMAACERERAGGDFESKWGTADEMFRAQELVVARTYYAELDQKMKTVAAACVLTEIPLLEELKARDGTLEPVTNVVGAPRSGDPLSNEQARLLELDRLLRADERNAKVRFERAELRLALKDTLGALEDLDRLIEGDPSVAAYFTLRANIQSLRSKEREARADLERAVALEPARGDLYVRLGRSLGRLKDRDGAERAFSRALELEPRAETYFLRGMGHLEGSRLDRAIDDFTRALELDPSYQTALLQRGIARARTDETAAAIADLDRFLAGSPTAEERAVAERWLATAQASP